jgi:hypothetical protein
MPLNPQATRDLLYCLAQPLLGLDNNWADHFLSTLFDYDNVVFVRVAARGGHLGISVQLAVELNETGAAIKSYFFSCRYGQAGLAPLE